MSSGTEGLISWRFSSCTPKDSQQLPGLFPKDSPDDSDAGGVYVKVFWGNISLETLMGFPAGLLSRVTESGKEMGGVERTKGFE